MNRDREPRSAGTRPRAGRPPADTQDTLVEVIRRHSELRPDKSAVVFLEDGEGPGIAVTYGELDARVRAIAGGLQEHGDQGDRVLLVYPPGIDYVLAFLA